MCVSVKQEVMGSIGSQSPLSRTHDIPQLTCRLKCCCHESRVEDGNIPVVPEPHESVVNGNMEGNFVNYPIFQRTQNSLIQMGANSLFCFPSLSTDCHVC